MSTTPDTKQEQTDIVVATIPRGKDTEIKFSLRTYRGSRFADIRTWTSAHSDGDETFPTKKGVTVSADMLPAVKRAIDQMYDAAVREGWLEE